MSATLSESDTARVAARPTAGRARAVAGLLRVPKARWALVATASFAVGGVLHLIGAPTVTWWAMYLACYATGGWEPALAGLRAARARTLDVDLLMIVAAIVAAAIGQIFDGALLIVIFATSGALEAVATNRTADSVRALLDLAPDRVVRLDAAGGEERIDATTVAVHDVLRVRPGERIGADAVVIDGLSEVDQASITGEPLPVTKTVGSRVFAGTVNGTGSLRIRVDRPAAESVVARIVAQVEQASATKAKAQLFIERIEQRYSVGVVVATVALFVVPLLFGAGLQTTLLRAMTFMIVASPCAVVLATMPPLLSAIANAGRHGVLVKSAVVMEQLAVIDRIALDKTGTLTHGTPRLAEVRLAPGAAVSEQRLLGLAAAAERLSEHPLAAAIVAAADADADGIAAVPAQRFTSTPGRGVSALVDGHTVQVGSPRLLGDDPATNTGIRAVVSELDSGGASAVVVVIDGVPAGVLGLVDRMRADAPDAVDRLRAATEHPPVLLTGDNPRAAHRLAAQVSITDVRAALLPADKVAHVNQLQLDGSRVLLVGDGVNDAPALATAHLGVAMGVTGSDLALETADAVVIRDELGALPAVIELSRRARRVVVANLVIAAGVITGLVAWDLTGHLPLPLGVAGHEGSTVIVGLNGLRLLRTAAWRRASQISPQPRTTDDVPVINVATD